MIDRPRESEGDLDFQAHEFTEQMLQFAASARDRIAEGCEGVRDYVVKEPARALSVALGVGVLLGWLIKRR